jgi:putative ABC transport system permease protein
MTRLIQDIRFAVRGLLKAPAFTIGVVLTLALGIGINATMFGVVDTLFLRAPAGVANPDRIVRVYFRRTYGAMGTFTGAGSTFPSYTDLRDGVPGFAQTMAYTTRAFGLGRGADAVEVKATAVSYQFFPMLGLKPALGRFFTDAEDRTGGDRVAVLTYRFWQRHFGGDPGVIGRALPLGKGTYTVIGVGPREFTGIDLAPVDLILPIHPAAEGEIVPAEAIGSRNWSWMSSIARLAPGVSAATAAAQATVAFRRGVSAEGRKDSTSQVMLGPIQESRRPETSSDAKVALWIGVVAAIVLLIACANVANLLLARGVARRRELAVRASLGAGRGGLIRALLTESLVLAFAGGVTAVVLAIWAGGAARGLLLPDLPSDVPLIDTRMLLFTGAAVLAATLLTGLVPAIQASRTDLVSAFKSGGHGTTGHGSATRTTLLVTQIALTLVLLVGAGLFVRSLRNVQDVDLGFDADRVLGVTINLSGAGMANAEANKVYLRLLDRFQQIPGVERAAASMGTPFDNSWSQSTRAEGIDSIPSVKSGGPYYQAVTPGYFATIGTRVVRGRDFTAADVAGSPPVTIVGASFARLVWPRQEAIGKCLYLGDDSTRTCTRVVAVAADAKRGGVTETESLLYYVPFAQYTDRPVINGVFVRMRPGTLGLAAALMREVQAVGNLPFPKVQSIADQVVPQLRSWRLGAEAFTAFGLLALLIAATGIFAVLSYGVSQRTKEIGVRVALGAQSGHVVRMIVGQGMRAAVIGAVLGIVGAVGLGRAIASLLYQVPPTDPAVFGGVVVILLSVAAAAAYLPARRASQVAPMIALRSE